jgi:hypothetical protein
MWDNLPRPDSLALRIASIIQGKVSILCTAYVYLHILTLFFIQGIQHNLMTKMDSFLNVVPIVK